MQSFKYITLLSFIFVSVCFSANFNVKGSDRLSMELINNLNLVPGGSQKSNGAFSDTKTYMLNRILLTPEVLIDDHFSIFMEWDVRQYFNAAGTDVPPISGAILGNSAVSSTNPGIGSNAAAHFAVTKAWLNWMTDWGITKIGRFPKDWGIGLQWNSGKNNTWGDYSSTGTGINYTAMLGNVSLTLGFEKLAEGFIDVEQDDIDVYHIGFEYNSVDVDLDMGLCWERIVAPDYSGTTPGLSSSQHILDIYLKKKIFDIDIGFELLYKTGKAGVDDNDAGTDVDSFSALGVAAEVSYWFSYFSLDLRTGYASGDSSDTDGQKKNMSFHQNFTPSLMLFREDLGEVKTKSSGRATMHGGYEGNAIGKNLNDTTGNYLGSGAFFMNTKFNFYAFKKRFSTGVNFTMGFLTGTMPNVGRMLGYEIDADVHYKWYKNFSTSMVFGLLISGNAYNSVVGQNAQNPWMLVANAALKF